MREIKFKGVTNDDLVIYSSSICQEDGGVLLKWNGLWRSIKPKTLSQYTGNKDSNGYDVYSGDKIESGGTQMGVIEVRESKSGWMPFRGTRPTNWDSVLRGTILK